MDLNHVRQLPSAVYRSPEPSESSRPVPARARPDSTRFNGRRDADKTDPVKKDQMWREAVHKELRGGKEWEKNWSFLKEYDQMGRLKPETPLPSNTSLFSDRLPNTTNQMFGSSLSTLQGKELIRLDRLSLWSGHRRRPGPETLLTKSSHI